MLTGNGDTLTVDTLADVSDANDGFMSLREAIAAAPASGGLVEFHASLAQGVITLNSQLTIPQSIIIKGLGADQLTVTAGGNHRIFQVNAGAVATISGLKLTGGSVADHGGAILNYGTLTLNRVEVSGNTAAGVGGAVASISDSSNAPNSLSINDSTIRDNHAMEGSGVAAYPGGGTFEIKRSTISDNASQVPMALEQWSAGGAIQLVGAVTSPLIENSTISGNSSAYVGGIRLWAVSSPLKIVNSTIALNRGLADGAGIDVAGGSAAPIVHSSIIAQNANGIAAPVHRDVNGNLNASSSYSLFGSGAGGITLTGAGNKIGTPAALKDPKLSPLDNYGGPNKTHVPLPGSPVIDAGGLTGDAPATDQRGFGRLIERGESNVISARDMGAVELSAQLSAVGDFNGDGREDKVLFDGLTRSLQVSAASAAAGGYEIGSWGEVPSEVTLFSTFVVGDFNGDARDDLLISSSGVYRLAVSDGSTFLIQAAALPATWSAVYASDFDGDGSDEILGGTLSGGNYAWSVADYRDAFGLSTPRNVASLSGFAPSFQQFFQDVNRDGRVDVITRSSGSAPWMVRLSGAGVDGSLSFTAAADWNAWINYGYNAATATLDADKAMAKVIDEFSWVYNNVELQLYPGLMKGPEATRLTKSGNDWDQGALLVERLEAAGFQADIANGVVEVSSANVRKWLGAETSAAALAILQGVVDKDAVTAANGSIRFQHAWVRVKVPTSTGLGWVDLDPSWKFKDWQPGITTTPHVFDEFAFLEGVRGELPVEYFEDRVMDYLTSAGLNASLAEVGYNGPILQKQFTTLPFGQVAGVAFAGTLETFENFSTIVGTQPLRDRLTHRATIELGREFDTTARATSAVGAVNSVYPALMLPPLDGTLSHYAFDAQTIPFKQWLEIDSPGSASRQSNSVGFPSLQLNGTEWVAVQIPYYPMNADVRIRFTFESNTAASRTVLLDQDDDYDGNAASGLNERGLPFSYDPADGLKTYDLPLGEVFSQYVGGQANWLILYSGAVSASSWGRFSNISLFKPGSTTVATGSVVEVQGADTSQLELTTPYVVTRATTLEFELKIDQNSPVLTGIGWDIDSSSANDATQLSRKYQLAGSGTAGYVQTHNTYSGNGYVKFIIPIGAHLPAGVTATMERLLFISGNSFTHKASFKNIIFREGSVGVAGNHWSHSVVVPASSLSSINVDYVKNENVAGTPNDDTYTSRLLINGSVVEMGSAGEVFQLGDKAKLKITHFGPSDLSSLSQPSNLYTRGVGQILAVSFDANQYSQRKLVDLQSDLNSLLLDGDDVSDIDNSSALENAIIEEVVNSASISTMQGLTRAHSGVLGVRFDGSSTEEAVQVFESIPTGVGNERLIYYRGELGHYAQLPYLATRTALRTPSQLLAQENGGLKNHTQAASQVVDLLLNVTYDTNGQPIPGNAVGTIRILIPRAKSSLGDWKGSVYVAEYETTSGRRGSYIIAPDSGVPSSGGFAGNAVTSKNAFLPDGNYTYATYTGDPVNVANGNMFRDETDIAFTNAGVPLSFSRHYDAQSKDDFGMGVGWMYSFGDVVYEENGKIVWLDASGTRSVFEPASTTVYNIPDNLLGKITSATASAIDIIFKSIDGIEYHFEKVALTESGKAIKGRLSKIVDVTGYGVRVVYRDQVLTEAVTRKILRVEDVRSAARNLAFTYQSYAAGTNHILNISKVSPGSATVAWFYAHQAIDANRYLTSVQAPSVLVANTSLVESYSNPTVQYAYYTAAGHYSKGLMQRITEPDGAWQEYEYFANGRAFRIKQGDANQQSSDPNVDVQAFNYNLYRDVTEFTDELGNLETYFHRRNGLLSKQVHADRSQAATYWGSQDTTAEYQMVGTRSERGASETFVYYNSISDGFKQGLIKQSLAKRSNGEVTVWTDYDYSRQASKPHLIVPSATIIDKNSSKAPPSDGSYDGQTITTTRQYYASGDAVGQLWKVIDARGNTVEYVYYSSTDTNLNARRLLQSIKYPAILSNQETPVFYEMFFEEYDAAGNPTKVTTRNSTTQEVIATSLSSYDLLGNVIRAVDPTGVVTESVLDALGRLHETGYGDANPTIDPQDAFTNRFKYDAAGRVRESIDPLGRSTKFEYDRQGNIVRQINPDGTVLLREYDAFGNCVAVTDALDRTTRFVYDNRNRLIQTLHPDGAVERLRYDGAGNVLAKTDALGNVTTFKYNGAGRLVETQLPDPDGPANAGAGVLTAPTTTNKYDKIGNLVETIDPEANVTQFKYDNLGRVVQTQTLKGVNGNRTASTPWVVTGTLQSLTTTDYDAMGNVVKTAVYDVSLYDAAATSTLLADPRAQQTPANIAANKVQVVAMRYDALGRLVKTINADSTTTSTDYDAAGRVRYQHDELNRVTEFRYDAFGRLDKALLPDPVTGAITAASPTTSYRYDAAGNRVGYCPISVLLAPPPLEPLFARSIIGEWMPSTSYGRLPQRSEMRPLRSPDLITLAA